MNEAKDVVTMAHGSGGRAMQQLIDQLFLRAFDNRWLNQREDGAQLSLASLSAQGDRLAFTTDSYVIDPVFSPAVTSASWRYVERLTIWRSAVRHLAGSRAALFWKRAFPG